jgi:hypothetical protein
VTQPTPGIPVIDVDQAYPTFTSDGAGRPPATGSDNTDATPTVQNALRDILGWRPRPRDTSAFEAALTASFQLSIVEDHVVATYSPRGYAMQADLGAVTGGQASLYSRAVAARSQMITLLDGLTPLRPDPDQENCEAFRSLVRDAVTALVDELGTPGGPRVAVVGAYLQQLLGAAPANVGANVTGDDVSGQLGQIRDQFGLTSFFVNNVGQEGIRTAFWTLTDMTMDINRAWVNLSPMFAGGGQPGFLGTDLILISQLLSAAAEQLDDVESALDSVFVSAAERQTITLASSQGLTVGGLLSWIRTVVTDQGPRIARDTGRDGIRTSLLPTLMDITGRFGQLVTMTGQLTFTPPVTFATLPVPHITLNPQSPAPPGMQAARVQIAIAGLSSLIWRLTQRTTTIAGYSAAVLFDALAVQSIDNEQLQLAVRGLNIEPGLVPVFADPRVDHYLTPIADRLSYDDDTVSAIFDVADLDDWLDLYDAAPGCQRPWARRASSSGRLAGVTSRFFPANALPIGLQDAMTGNLVPFQTRP